MLTYYFNSYEVITTPTDIIMVIEYAGRELFNYIVEKGRVSIAVNYQNVMINRIFLQIDG